LVIAMLLVTAARAQNPPSGYVHETWTVRDGLPVNCITQLVQSRNDFQPGQWIVYHAGADDGSAGHHH